MVSEVALALLLLVGAGLLVRSFLRLRDVQPGFDTRDLLALQISLPTSGYAEPRKVSAFYREALERVEALPGVKAAAATSHLPVGASGFNLAVMLEGAPAPKLALAGLMLGSLAALALSRFLATLVFGISSRDPLTFVGVGALLLAVSLLASYLPARRAARLDPLTALRYE